MTFEANICSQCGLALKESDDYCPQCGKFKNSSKDNFMSKFKIIFITSFLISVIYPVGSSYLFTNIFSAVNSQNIASNQIVNINTFLGFGQFLYYISIVFIAYIFCMVTYHWLNRNNINKFILFEFIITGLGSIIGMLISNYIVPVFVTKNFIQQFNIVFVPIYAIIAFFAGGLMITPLFIFGMLLQNLPSKTTDKVVHYPKFLVFIFALGLGLISSFLLNSLNYLTSNYVINTFRNGGFNNDLIMLSLALNFSSIAIIVIEIILIYFFVTKYSIYLEEKRIFQDGLVNYVAIVIGSFLGFLFAFLAFNLIFSQSLTLGWPTNVAIVVTSFSSGLSFALPICILLLSGLLIYRKVSLTNQNI